MTNRTIPRVNLLRSHGSPTRHCSVKYGCQCIACLSAIRDYQNGWRARHPGYMTKYRDNWKHRYPEKRRAQKAVANAIQHKRLERQPCEVCRSAPAEAHHDDYEKPLDVRWLCMPHHRELHRREVQECNSSRS